MFIDTHCHLTDRYADGTDGIIRRAIDNNVGIMICPTADPTDIPSALALAEQHSNIYCTIGIHPEYTPCDATQHLTDTVLNHPRVVGVGEIGLEYHYSPQTRDAQIKLFEDVEEELDDED